jgi:hypothetical protein
VTSPSRYVLIALLVAAALAGCTSQKGTLKPTTLQPRPLAVSDVRKAFADEGLALDEAPFDENSARPVTLVSRGGPSLFAVIVYGPSSVSVPLGGIRLSDSHHLVVRVRNVLISYSAAASTTAEVQAAVQRLRQSKKRTAPHYSAKRFKHCLVAQHVDVTLTRDASSASTAALIWLPTFAEWVYFFRTPEAATAERVKLKSSIVRARRTFFRLFRAQRLNVLIFAPARKEWLSPIGLCLQHARA